MQSLFPQNMYRSNFFNATNISNSEPNAQF